MATISYPLRAGNVLTRVIEVGKGPKTVVFIHGLAARADRWVANLEPIARAGYRCCAIDLPGHGFAEKSADYPYGVPAFADFVTDFLDAAEIEHATIIGTSLGGHVGALFACDHPDKVSALVLVGSVGIVPFGREAGEIARTRSRNISRDGIAQKLRFVFAEHSLVTEELIDEEYRINNSPGAAAALEQLGSYIAERIDEDNVGNRLIELAKTKPVLLVWGALDRSVPLEIGQQALRKIKSAELVTIAGGGHVPYLEHPQVFNTAVLEFLKKAEA